MQYIIIGAGIIGSTIARELLLRKKGQVIVLEKESSLGMHASGRNSCVVHSGINQKPGSIKARMCVRGNKLLRDYCKKHKVKLNECGTLVIARNKKEEKTLQTLLSMGKKCGVSRLRIIDKQELLQREPCSSGDKALFSPTGAVVDSNAFLHAVAKEAMKRGARFVMDAPVEKITGNTAHTPKGKFSGHIINCAGLYADTIAHMMGYGNDYAVIPFRGEYMEVKNLSINSMIYQPPNLKYPFLSVHLTKMTDNKVLAGPTATLSLGRESYNKQINVWETIKMMCSLTFLKFIFDIELWKLACQNAKISLSRCAFRREIQTLSTQHIPLKYLTSYRSGIRAQLVNSHGKMVNDIVVEFHKDSTHVLNTMSPGMTCSLSFAEYVVNTIA